MEPLTILLVMGIVALAAAAAFVVYVLERRRREALQAFAAAHGWTLNRRDDRWVTAFDGAPFHAGHNRQAHDVLTGSHRGRRFVGFDYVYYTTETDRDANGNTRTREVAHWHSVLALGIGADVPDLAVSPEGFFSRTVGKLFGNDIELESEAFNRAFRVTCPDRRFAYDILHPRLMEYLLTVRKVAWRTTNGHLITVSPGRRRLDEVEGRLTVLDRILDSVPDFVRRERGIPGTQEMA